MEPPMGDMAKAYMAGSLMKEPAGKKKDKRAASRDEMRRKKKKKKGKCK